MRDREVQNKRCDAESCKSPYSDQGKEEDDPSTLSNHNRDETAIVDSLQRRLNPKTREDFKVRFLFIL